MKSKGFTLPELVATVAIATILTAVAVPTFREVIATNRLATDANRLMSMLHFARTEAISNTTIVSICAGSNGKCSEKWNEGIIVFTDANADCVVDAGDIIKRVTQGSTTNKATGLGCISFNARGAKTVPGKTTISFCNPNLSTKNIKDIEIETGGRSTVITKDGGC